MSGHDSKNSRNSAVLEQAAEYYLALQDESMTGAELQAWQKWFLRSKEHQRSFKKLEALWGALDSLNIDDFEVRPMPLKGAGETHVSSGSIIGLVAGGEQQVTATANRGWLNASWASSIAAGLAVVVMTGYMYLTPSDVSNLAPISVYQSSLGQQRVVTLTDGSILELGPNSEVDVQYSSALRSLTLVRGQAIFTVSKNPNRPFVVNAGNGSVTALGTVFNVRKMDGDVHVRVLEGTVAVRPIVAQTHIDTASTNVVAPVALLTTGLQTQFSHEGFLSVVEKADVHEGLGWRVGILKMVNRELSDVVGELNRYMENEISIGDNAVGRFRFTGTVYPDQVDEWLEGLQRAYPLKVVRVGSSIVLMQSNIVGIQS